MVFAIADFAFVHDPCAVAQRAVFPWLHEIRSVTQTGDQRGQSHGGGHRKNADLPVDRSRIEREGIERRNFKPRVSPSSDRNGRLAAAKRRFFH